MIVVREIETGDADAVADVHVESWRAAYRGIVPDAVLDDPAFRSNRVAGWRARSFDAPAPGAGVLVACRDGGVVGFGNVGPERTDENGAPTGLGEVFAFYLHPAAWGSGAAAPLMAACEARLHAGGFPTAVLWVFRDNPRARAFYAKAGWSLRPGHPESTFEVCPGVQRAEVQYHRRLGAAHAL